MRHSLSPAIHNAAFAKRGIDAVYRAVRIGSASLAAAVEGLRSPAFLGANVTIPHKQSVRKLLDEVDGDVDATGAVNTIVVEDGRLLGRNTDVQGFLTPLSDLVELPASALILGSGGSARAICYALRTRYPGIEITIAARNVDRARAMVADRGSQVDGEHITAVPWPDAASRAESTDMVVNATPVGMDSHSLQSPLPGVHFRPGQILYDLVYAPLETRFLRDGARHGARTISGIEMLLSQAALSFAIWTGEKMPVGHVRNVALKAAHREGA